jgi:putative drug exporter of the RND superfamily
MTGAALVMLCAFVTLAASDAVAIRQLGTGLAIAVVLDALIVRPVLLPAAVAVLGRWAWWPTSRRRAHGDRTLRMPHDMGRHTPQQGAA